MLEIEPDQGHLWMFQFEDKMQASDYIASLSVDEKERARAYRTNPHQNRFIIIRGYLRYILSLYLDLSPAEIRFTYSEHKKPALAANPLNLQFNLSHTKDCVVIALTLNAAIGVDIEKESKRPFEALVKRYFSSAEQAQFFDLEMNEQKKCFYTLWTKKEALLKALGSGLSQPLSSFSVSPVLEKERLELNGRSFYVLAPSAKEGYALAVACEKPLELIYSTNAIL